MVHREGGGRTAPGVDVYSIISLTLTLVWVHHVSMISGICETVCVHVWAGGFRIYRVAGCDMIWM